MLLGFHQTFYIWNVFDVKVLFQSHKPVSKNYRPENGILLFSFPFYILYYQCALRQRLASFSWWGKRKCPEMYLNVNQSAKTP